ncbi:MAG: hypothetical protein JO291_11645 [Acidimicrobiia bacterium]|nr:hypothetical protein [Acidimicrobiia bacterium]
MSTELDLELAGALQGGTAPDLGEPTELWWRAGTLDTRAVDLVQIRFGFVPTTWIHFRIGPGDVGPQLDQLAAIVAAAVAAAPGDAILHADFEEVWLVRRGGELALSDDDTRWPPARAALLGPHTRAALDPPSL